MDRQKRGEVQAEVEARILEKQKAHIAALEALEEQYGLDLDAFTDLYGEGVLDGSSKHAEELRQQWEKLYELLASDEPYVAVVGTHAELAPGCYGFGQRARYHLSLNMVLLEGGEDRSVEFVRNQDGSVDAVIHGLGHIVSTSGDLPDHDEATAVSFTLMSNRPEGLLGRVNNLDHLLGGNDTYDIYNQVLQCIGNDYEFSSPHEKATRWLLDHSSRRARFQQTLTTNTTDTK